MNIHKYGWKNAAASKPCVRVEFIQWMEINMRNFPKNSNYHKGLEVQIIIGNWNRQVPFLMHRNQLIDAHRQRIGPIASVFQCWFKTLTNTTGPGLSCRRLIHSSKTFLSSFIETLILFTKRNVFLSLLYRSDKNDDTITQKQCKKTSECFAPWRLKLCFPYRVCFSWT